jgi:hypothetical protein
MILHASTYVCVKERDTMIEVEEEKRMIVNNIKIHCICV